MIRDRDDVQQVGVGGLAHVVPGRRHARDGGTDGRHLVERGVRARVAGGQGGIEPNGPAPRPRTARPPHRSRTRGRMSIAAVKAHVSRLLEKLEFNNRVQIALLAHDAGEA